MKSLESFLRSLLANYTMDFNAEIIDLDCCTFTVVSTSGDLLFQLSCGYKSIVLYFNVPGSFEVKFTIDISTFVDEYYEVVVDIMRYFASRSKRLVKDSQIHSCLVNILSNYRFEILTGV